MDSFEERLRQLRRSLVRTMGARGVPRGDVDDVVQQALLELVRRRRDVEHWPAAALFCYARRASFNAYLKSRRGALRRQQRELSWSRHHEATASAPEDAAIARQALAEVEMGIEAMKPELKLVVHACQLEDQSHAQAARHLGIPVGTLKSRLRKALVDLETRVQYADRGPTQGLSCGRDTDKALSGRGVRSARRAGSR